MKWLMLPVLLLSFPVFAQDAAPNMQAGGAAVSGDTCKTPEGQEFKKGKPGYKNCVNRKKRNRDDKKMPKFHESNDGMGMGIREGN